MKWNNLIYLMNLAPRPWSNLQYVFPGKFPMDSGHPDYLAPPKPGRPLSSFDESFDPVNEYEPESKDLVEPDDKRVKLDEN